MAQALHLPEHIGFDNVLSFYQEGLRTFESSQWTVNCAHVKRVDSSALALLLAWLREAQKQGAQLVIEQLPSSLRDLMDVYGVTNLFHTT